MTWRSHLTAVALGIAALLSGCSDSGGPLHPLDREPETPPSFAPESDLTPLVADAFGRTLADGWGTADVGGAWRIDPSDLGYYSVDGSAGIISKPHNGPTNVIASEGYAIDVEGVVSFSIDDPPDLSSRFYTVQVYARRDDREKDGDDYYRYRVRSYGDGRMDVRVEKNVNMTLTWLTDNIDLPFRWAPGQKYWIRWEAVGTSPATHVRMRVWVDGTTEPTGWNVDVTVDEPALDVEGTTGIRVSGPNGTEQTTFPVTYRIDNLLYGTPATDPPLNDAPTADAGGPYTGVTGFAVTFDGSGSVDPDGDPLSYRWDFGDGEIGTGVTPSHVYAAAGTYTVSLVVTDSSGATSDTARTVATIADPENTAPVADAGGPYSGIAGEPIAFDGSGSADPDNDRISHAWSFGDGATASGSSPSHSYAAAGTYTVILVVTDEHGATSADTTRAEVAAAPTNPDILVADAFSRSVTSGWGNADVGGKWILSSGRQSDFRVENGRGFITKMDNAPRNAVAQEGYGLDVTGSVAFSIDHAPDQANRYLTLQLYARRNDLLGDGRNYYRYQIRAFGNGTMDLRVEKNVDNRDSWITPVVDAGIRFVPGTVYRVRWECFGASPATRIRMKIWVDGTSEPVGWHIDATISEPALDHPGTTGFRATGPNGTEQRTFPITFAFDDLVYQAL